MMVTNKKPSIDSGAGLIRDIYSNAKLEIAESQPIYVIHRDTIRSFLHEKIEAFGSLSKFLGFLGIELSLIASLLTATFGDWHGIKGSVIEGTFIALVIVFLGYAIKEAWFIIKHWGSTDINKLADELGERGSVIKASNSDQDC